MKTIEKILNDYSNTSADEWTRHKEAWIHQDAKIGPNATIHGGEFRGGEFRGGEFHDGAFFGGVFLGGVFRGGEFRGGVFRGGVFRGGVFLGGVFLGSVFLGGVFRGGVFKGGVFKGGVFEGGIFLDGIFLNGIFEGSPLLLAGLLPWLVHTSAPDTVSIGCETHTLEEWGANLHAILAKHGAQQHQNTIETALAICKQWFKDHPYTIRKGAK